MRASIRTGRGIAEEIADLHTAYGELNRAVDQLERGTLPHTLLMQAKEAKLKELQAAQAVQYIVHTGQQ